MPPFDPPRSDAIRIRGARQNNLKDLDLDLPLNELIVVTGVSGTRFITDLLTSSFTVPASAAPALPKQSTIDPV